MSWSMLLLLIVSAYLVLIGALLMLIARKRRRSRRAWQDWHGRQGAKVASWRRLFGRSHVKRLPHLPPAEESPDPAA